MILISSGDIMNREIKHVGVALEDTPTRKAGCLYGITSDLRSKRVKFLESKGGDIKSCDKKTFLILDDKYIKDVELALAHDCYPSKRR